MADERFVVVLLYMPDIGGGSLYRAMAGNMDTMRPDEKTQTSLFLTYTDAAAYGDAQECWGYRIEKWHVKGRVEGVNNVAGVPATDRPVSCTAGSPGTTGAPEEQAA